MYNYVNIVENGIYSDLQVIIGPKTLNLHKIILLQSPYFKSKIQTDLSVLYIDLPYPQLNLTGLEVFLIN